MYVFREQMVDPKIAECLLCLYERPMEPTFILKGERNIFFDVPEKWLVSYKNTFLIRSELNHFCLNKRIHGNIKDLQIL